MLSAIKQLKNQICNSLGKREKEGREGKDIKYKIRKTKLAKVND